MKWRLASRWIRRNRIASCLAVDSWPRTRRDWGSAGDRSPCRTCSWSAEERPDRCGPAESSSDWMDAAACSRSCPARCARRSPRWRHRSRLVRPFETVSDWAYWAMCKAARSNRVCCLEEKGWLVGIVTFLIGKFNEQKRTELIEWTFSKNWTASFGKGLKNSETFVFEANLRIDFEKFTRHDVVISIWMFLMEDALSYRLA